MHILLELKDMKNNKGKGTLLAGGGGMESVLTYQNVENSKSRK